jgi:glutamate dehydrogenase (NAD(P)+)
VRRGERVLGFLVVHSLCRGTSRGGMRLAADISEAEVRLLAEGMTLKFGLLGLPQGGAKAGIRADPDAPEAERYAALKEFGEAVAPLLRNRLYMPGPDMGTSNEMVRRMLVSVGVRVRRRELRGLRSGYFTALSVFSAARHAADSIGLGLAGAGVAIEGFGKVGSSLAQLFQGLGAKVVTISTSRGALYHAEGLDVGRLVRAYQSTGSSFVENFEGAERCARQAVFEVPADVLCPCARHNSITAASAAGIRARIIAPGSNHPYDLDTERKLVAKGIAAVPYWVANCGGTLGETMEFSGWRDTEIAEFIHRRLEPHVRGPIREAQKTGLTPTEIAKPRTLARFARVAEQAARPGVKGQVMGLGLECYRRGLAPAGLMRILSKSYFEGAVLLPFEQDAAT